MALDFTQTGAVIVVTYTEPVTNADNSPLLDLAKTTISWRVASDPYTRLDVPAAAATGGGAISQEITIPVFHGQSLPVEVFTTATDLAGNESLESNHVIKVIDLLAPAPPA